MFRIGRVSAGLSATLLSFAAIAFSADAAAKASGAQVDANRNHPELLLAAVPAAALPAEAQRTRRLIETGGPFPYDKDGSVFGNRESLLPYRPRGYYREYTVPTPGARDRGARRIICGGVPPTRPERCFYTADHYSSFRQISQ